MRNKTYRFCGDDGKTFMFNFSSKDVCIRCDEENNNFCYRHQKMTADAKKIVDKQEKRMKYMRNYLEKVEFKCICCTVIGNKIGTNITGTDTIPNYLGIFVADSNIVIGGNTSAESNLISGNTIGIKSEQPTTIIGNKIGTDITGTIALPNNTGIELWASAHNTLVLSNLI